MTKSEISCTLNKTSPDKGSDNFSDARDADDIYDWRWRHQIEEKSNKK